jgi:hypothetical protein
VDFVGHHQCQGLWMAFAYACVPLGLGRIVPLGAYWGGTRRGNAHASFDAAAAIGTVKGIR